MRPPPHRSGGFRLKILGMDSSSRCRSVALCEAGDGTDGAFKVLASVGAASMRGGRFASLIDEVLSEAGCAVDEVDELALGVGQIGRAHV